MSRPTIIHSPQLYTPSQNPVMYQFGTTNSNTLYFNIGVYQYPSNYLILTDRAYVSPVNPNGAEYNMSDVMKDIVKWEINSTTSILKPVSRSINQYYLKVSEWGLSGSVITQLGTTKTTNRGYVWNGKLDRNEFYRYDWENFVVNDGFTYSPMTFLTTKPDYYKTNDESFEQLYFLNGVTSSYNYVIDIYNDNIKISSHYGTVSGTSSMYRLNVSPRDFMNLYLWNDGAQYDRYSVRLVCDGVTASNVKFYKKEPVECRLDTMNVVWVNKMGGIDSYQFVNKVETKSAERVVMNRSIYSYDSQLNYTERRDNILNVSDEVIHINNNSTYKLWTKPLTDDEAYWLSGLLESKQIFIELKDEERSLYPVVLVESNYEIKRQLFNRASPLQVQFSFKVNGDLIPREFTPESLVPSVEGDGYRINWIINDLDNPGTTQSLHYFSAANLTEDPSGASFSKYKYSWGSNATYSTGFFTASMGDVIAPFLLTRYDGYQMSIDMNIVDNGNLIWSGTSSGSWTTYKRGVDANGYTVNGPGTINMSIYVGPSGGTGGGVPGVTGSTGATGATGGTSSATASDVFNVYYTANAIGELDSGVTILKNYLLVANAIQGYSLDGVFTASITDTISINTFGVSDHVVTSTSEITCMDESDFILYTNYKEHRSYISDSYTGTFSNTTYITGLVGYYN